jgi:membrane fusion protein, multidrug efflux system
MAGLGSQDDNLIYPPDADRKAEQRKRLFAVFGGVLTLIALGAGSWWWLVASRYVSTDNAYANVSTAQVTPLTSGTAQEVSAQNAQFVRKGDVLLKIDPTDARLAYDQADAAYGLTVRKVETYFANLTSAQAAFERAKLEYDRRAGIRSTGAVSQEEFSTVKAAYDTAAAALASAEAMTRNTDVENHPEVLAAKAARDTAKLNLDRTVVRAPVDGIVSQRSVQVGQRVQAGTPVMVVVPIQDVYVDANFKEDQLAKVHSGQTVELTADLYGSSVKFHGTVAGIGGGTGSAFSIIPAQNATGNWIKVVQRVPVRINLDAAELKQHPLRVGLSMTAAIDVSK